jgi:hypothetical protein
VKAIAGNIHVFRLRGVIESQKHPANALYLIGRKFRRVALDPEPL